MLQSSSSVLAGIGPYVEMAFFHKATRTLLTTDAVILVPQRPPEVHSQLPSGIPYILQEHLLRSVGATLQDDSGFSYGIPSPLPVHRTLVILIPASHRPEPTTLSC